MKARREALYQMLPYPEFIKKGMDFTEVCRAIRFAYCPLMTRNGLCTTVCRNCRDNIVGAMNDMQDGPKNNIHAVFTFRLKDRVYKQLVEKSEGEKTLPVGRSPIGILIEIEDPFIELESIYA
jgi:hypothetical protein